MNRFDKIAVCLAGGLALNAGLRADSVPATGNPYALVVTRNIFGLNPPPPPVDPNAVPVEPPVKITLNGIMSVFGQVKALFKVAGKAPGKEASYMLTEGERNADDIEVVKIDEKNGMVTFNNHGVEQVLPLTSASATSPPAATAAVAGSSGIPGIPGPATSGTISSSGFSTAFGGRVPTAGTSIPAAANDPNLRNVPTRNNTFIQQPQSGMSELEQTAIIELNRAATQPQVDRGEMPPLPPTEGTPDGATSVGGRPLVTPPPGAPPQ